MDQGQQKKEFDIYVIKKKDRRYGTFINKEEYDKLQNEIKDYYQGLETFIEEWETLFEEKYPSLIQLKKSNEQFKEFFQQSQLFSSFFEFINKFQEAINTLKRKDKQISCYDTIQSITSLQSLKNENLAKESINNLNIAQSVKENAKNHNMKWFDEQNLINQIESDHTICQILQNLKFRNDITQNIRGLIIKFLQNIPNNVKYAQLIPSKQQEEQYFGNKDQNNQKIGLGFYKYSDDIAYFGCFNEDQFIWGCQVQAISNISYIIYQGYFAKGLIDNEGKMIGRDHQQKFSLYSGQFKSGQRSGYGIYAWYDEENKLHNDQNFEKCLGKYDGEWQFDQFNGEGTLSFIGEKKVIKGQFSNGQLVEDEQNTQITIENETLTFGEYKKKKNEIKQQQQNMENNKTTYPLSSGNQFHIAQNQQQQISNNFKQNTSMQSPQFNKNPSFGTQFNPPNTIIPPSSNINQNNNNAVLNTQQPQQKIGQNFQQQFQLNPSLQNKQELNNFNKPQLDFKTQNIPNNNTTGFRAPLPSAPTFQMNNFQNQQIMLGNQQQFNPNFNDTNFQNIASKQNQKK